MNDLEAQRAIARVFVQRHADIVVTFQCRERAHVSCGGFGRHFFDVTRRSDFAKRLTSAIPSCSPTSAVNASRKLSCQLRTMLAMRVSRSA